MPQKGLRSLGLAVTGMLLASCGAARAEFTVCNQTLDVVNLALGQEVEGSFQTEGWWTVGANQCVNLIKEELLNRYVYIHATDVFGQALLDAEGTSVMCVEPRRRFLIRGVQDCAQRGRKPASFLEVDTKDQARWTFFFRAP